ncbi:hypothetical protein TIFTF001_008486 [Ficus carica]|uniref:C2H2-type domain-containing protein n=1 Tax=Ficus carica TaxID=3494 RepID=A0AA88A4Y5_FICCA|nr:hypothetical protein TIFTF001_008486 [Ficus carica]
METQDDYHQVNKQMMIKGKRTKRHRAQSQSVSSLALSIAAPSSSSSTGGGGELVLLDGVSTSSLDDQSSVSRTMSRTTEEEDMANCLILLAQGRDRHDHHGDRDHPGMRNSEPARHVSDGVYQCKTCDRCFPSFQALGGHRASHKKPKGNNTTGQEKKTTSFLVVDHDYHEQFVNSATSTALSLQISSGGILGNVNVNSNNISCNNSNKPKVHECSVCGAEFTSGQALGGHMRRHRTTSFMAAPTATTTLSAGTTSSFDHLPRESKKPRNVLQLDLNLPAPDDDRRETKFPFSGKEQVIVFAASPLVDCHY